MTPKYKNYLLADFASDRSFINYCLGSNESDVSFWEDWQLRNPGRSDELAEARQIVLRYSLALQEVELLAERERFINGLNAQMEAETENGKSKSACRWKVFLRIAAILAVIFL